MKKTLPLHIPWGVSVELNDGIGLTVVTTEYIMGLEHPLIDTV